MKVSGFSFETADDEDLDMNGISAEDFALYPNPNDGNFRVTLTSNKAARYSFDIIDMTGRLVYQSNEEYQAGTNIKEFALLNVKEGLYFVRISQNNKTILSISRTKQSKNNKLKINCTTQRHDRNISFVCSK
jgi:hypothetical protein